MAVGGYGTVVFGLLTMLVFFSFSFFTNILCTSMSSNQTIVPPMYECMTHNHADYAL